MAYLAPITQRLRAILTEGAGSEYVITAGRFHRVASDVERCEPDAVERAVDLVVGRSTAVSGISSRIDGRDIRQTELAVRVGYRFIPEGSLDDLVDAAALGGATRDAIYERASSDAAVVIAACSSLVNIGSTDPSVIDLSDLYEKGWELDSREDRALLIVPFVLTTRATFPGSYGPAAT